MKGRSPFHKLDSSRETDEKKIRKERSTFHSTNWRDEVGGLGERNGGLAPPVKMEKIFHVSENRKKAQILLGKGERGRISGGGLLHIRGGTHPQKMGREGRV